MHTSYVSAHMHTFLQMLTWQVGSYSLMCTWSDTHAQVNMFVGEIGHVFPQLSIHTHSASSLRCA